MSLDPRILKRNETERQRLAALVQRLSDSDLRYELYDGWNVAIVLAHLAFWDMLDVELLARWQRADPPPVEPAWYADAVNDASYPAWRLVPLQQTVRLALDGAQAIDAAVALLDAPIVEALEARGEGWMLRRYLHRREHIAQIEGALGFENG